MFTPITATVALTTPASVDAAWAAFATVVRWPEVLPDLAAARIEPDGALAAGAIIKTIAQPDRNVIDMSYHVLAAEPPHRLVLQSRAEGYSARTTYEFAAVDPAEGAGTRVLATAAVTPERFKGRFASIFWRKLFIQQLERSVRRRATALLELAERIGAESDG